MLYLNKEDSEVLFATNQLLYELFQEGKITPEQEVVLSKFYRLRTDSEIYSTRRRNKAKQEVQAKRKIDKTYAHTRKKN